MTQLAEPCTSECPSPLKGFASSAFKTLLVCAVDHGVLFKSYFVFYSDTLRPIHPSRAPWHLEWLLFRYFYADSSVLAV